MRRKPGSLAPHLPAIRAAFAEGLTTYAVAKRFGATFQTIQHIRSGRNYPEGNTRPWVTRPSAVVNTHCAWCRTGTRATVIGHLRANGRADLREVSERYRVGYYYVRAIRSKATTLGCLPKRCKCGDYLSEDGTCAECVERASRPKPPPVRLVKASVMPWLLPPIGAAYLRRVA